jgi:DNA replication protein DnaC
MIDVDGFDEAMASRCHLDNGIVVEKFRTMMTNEEALICPSHVHGYNIEGNSWAKFEIDKLAPVSWQPEKWYKLEMDMTQKDTLRNLVSRQVTSLSPNLGKGAGLAFLFHGPPGTGKTFTVGRYSKYSTGSQTWDGC